MTENHPSAGGIRLVLGGNVFGWQIGRDQSFVVLDAFYEAGGRMIDTAEGYTSFVPGNKGGESETIIGEWMESRGVRKDMLIGTKTGMGAEPGALMPEAVAKALEGSLERLRTDYVDLYYAHMDNPDTPLDEAVSAFDEAYRSGKARELGGSNYTADRLAAILDTAERMNAQPFTVLQPHYNLVIREEYEGPLQDLCVARRIGVMPYFGLASGFLTGKYRNASEWTGSTRDFALDDAVAKGGWDVLAVMDAVVAETDLSHAEVALAWLNAQPGIIAPLASATKVEQLRQLVKAAGVALSDDQVTRLNAAK